MKETYTQDSGQKQMKTKEMERIVFLSLLTAVLSEHVSRQYHFINKKLSWIEAQSYCREKYTDLATIDNKNDTIIPDEAMKSAEIKYVWIGLQKTNKRKWPLDSSKGYVLEKQKKMWKALQAFCRENHTDLVSVRKLIENQKMMKIMKKNKTSKPWIGLFSDAWEWSDQSNSLFRNWSLGNPSGSINKKCAAVLVSGNQNQWEEKPCDTKYPFVCHQDQLVLIKKNLTWRKALKYCREHHLDLVSLHSQKMKHQVMEMAKNALTAEVWLGLRHSCVFRAWHWVSGEAVCHQNWTPVHLDSGPQDCCHETRAAAVQSGGEQLMISLPDSQKLNFICSNYKG